MYKSLRPLHWQQANWPSFLLWMLIFVLLYWAAWRISARLEVIPGLVSWFLPAGLRLIALLVLRPGRWFLLWLAEQIAIAAFVSLDYSYTTALQAAGDSALPWVCTAIPVYFLIHWRRPASNRLVSLDFVTRAALAALLGASLTATYLSISFTLSGVVAPGRIGELWPAFVLGDFVGMALVGSMTGVFFGARSPAAVSEWRWRYAIVPVAAVALELSLPDLLAWQAYFTKLLCLLPIVLAALRFGLWGVSLALLSINSMIVTGHLIDVPWGNMREDQFFLLAVCFGGIALGASNDDQRLLNQQLQRQNDRLRQLVEQLNLANSDYERLANRLMNAEERERSRIARELHDGLGQVLSAARIRLAAAQSMEPASAERDALIVEVEGIIEGAYATSREIMEQLAPVAIRHGGLAAALRGHELSDFLQREGIEYLLDIGSPLPPLHESVALNLLRIVQECANNTVRHARASCFTVRIGVDQQLLSLEIADDGQGFDPDSANDGMGLRNVRDRVAALGGTHDLQVVSPLASANNTADHGTRHRCVFHLPSLPINAAIGADTQPFFNVE